MTDNIARAQRSKNNRIISFILAVVILASTAFTGCSFQDNTSGGKYRNETDDGASFQDASNQTTQVSDINSATSRLVYDTQNDGYTGLFDSAQPFDTNNYYYNKVVDNGSKYGIELTAVINEDGNESILCKKVFCDHSNEKCSAFISMWGDYFTINGQRYFYSPMTTAYIDNPKDSENARVILFSVDENGLTPVAQLQGYVQGSGSVITDGENIYFTAQPWNNNDTFVMKMNIHTGDCVEIYKFPARLCLEEIRISDMTSDGSQLIFTARDGKNMGDYMIGVCSVKDGRFTITNRLHHDDFIDRNSGKNKADCTIIGNYIYVIDGDSGCMTKQRIGNQEKEVLFENIKDIIGDTDCVLMSYTYDNKMVLTRTGKNSPYLGNSKDFVLNLDTLEITPLEFRGEDSMGAVHLVRLFSATLDYFVVAVRNSNHNAYANEMALILKEDFYCNNIKTIPLGEMLIY